MPRFKCNEIVGPRTGRRATRSWRNGGHRGSSRRRRFRADNSPALLSPPPHLEADMNSSKKSACVFEFDEDDQSTATTKTTLIEEEASEEENNDGCEGSFVYNDNNDNEDIRNNHNESNLHRGKDNKNKDTKCAGCKLNPLQSKSSHSQLREVGTRKAVTGFNHEKIKHIQETIQYHEQQLKHYTLKLDELFKSNPPSLLPSSPPSSQGALFMGTNTCAHHTPPLKSPNAFDSTVGQINHVQRNSIQDMLKEELCTLLPSIQNKTPSKLKSSQRRKPQQQQKRSNEIHNNTDANDRTHKSKKKKSIVRSRSFEAMQSATASPSRSTSSIYTNEGKKMRVAYEDAYVCFLTSDSEQDDDDGDSDF